MNGDLSFREYERFSAYLDGQLSPEEVSRLEEDLRRNPQWRLALDELRETRALLRRAPRYRAPRNFTLTPEMVGKPARQGFFSFLSARLATGMAAAALVATLLLQFLPALRFAAPMAAAPAPQAVEKAAEMQAVPQETQPASLAPESAMRAAVQPTATAPIIIWNAPGGLGGGSGAPEGYGGEAMKAAGAPSQEGIVTYQQDTTAQGMGGGGGEAGASDMTLPGEGIVYYGDQPAPGTIPPVVPTEAPSRALMSEATPAEPLEDNGPILGVPAPGEAGQVIAALPAPEENARPSAAPLEAPAPFWTPVRVAQAVLLGMAALFAGMAVWLRRKG